MTKEDISLIAAVLRAQLEFAQTYSSNAPASCLLNAVYALSGALADSVGRFDQDEFLRECGVEGF